MKRITDHLREHMLGPMGERLPDLPVLSRTEWVPAFETAMRRRLIMGAFRYGRMVAPGKGRFDFLGSLERRLAAYRHSGNLEHLVDCANLAMLEFAFGRHPRRHWRPSDDADHVTPTE